jgi:hypothetical protein
MNKKNGSIIENLKYFYTYYLPKAYVYTMKNKKIKFISDDTRKNNLKKRFSCFGPCLNG